MAVGPILDKGGSAKKAAPVARYIPSYAKATGVTTEKVAAANTAAVKAGTAPKATNVKTGSKAGLTPKPKPPAPVKSTGSIEKGIVKKTEDAKKVDLESELPLSETLNIEAAQNVYDANAALRKFQREQAGRQLTDALGEIDRAAIENYKGIANDYAARGMARSGGFMGAESAAMSDKTRADAQANQAVKDFLDQLDLGGISDLNTLNTTKKQIMADYLARRFAAPQGG